VKPDSEFMDRLIYGSGSGASLKRVVLSSGRMSGKSSRYAAGLEEWELALLGYGAESEEENVRIADTIERNLFSPAGQELLREGGELLGILGLWTRIGLVAPAGTQEVLTLEAWTRVGAGGRLRDDDVTFKPDQVCLDPRGTQIVFSREWAAGDLRSSDGTRTLEGVQARMTLQARHPSGATPSLSLFIKDSGVPGGKWRLYFTRTWMDVDDANFQFGNAAEVINWMFDVDTGGV
jgi:hypothetical protein